MGMQIYITINSEDGDIEQIIQSIRSSLSSAGEEVSIKVNTAVARVDNSPISQYNKSRKRY